MEHYVNVLNAYSILYFGILGNDTVKLNELLTDKNPNYDLEEYDVSTLYLEFIDKFLKINYEKNPFLVVVLKHYINCSSELFEKHKPKFLKNFQKIQDEILPKIKNYRNTEMETDMPIFKNHRNKEELNMEIKILETTLKETLSSKKVKTKFVKYDEHVRDYK